jgi:hypothetical protein
MIGGARIALIMWGLLWSQIVAAPAPEVFSVTHIGHGGQRSWRVTCTLTWLE